MSDHLPSHPSRRQFVATSAATIGTLAASRMVHAQGSDILKVGLVGCGGRGTGAATQALTADSRTELVAMGDVFRDRLDTSLRTMQNREIAPRVKVDEAMKFIGFDAYQKVIEVSDIVLLATTPHFRPMHLRAAIEAGKHVFAEKPVAVDAPGIRSVLETTELARQKNLSIVSGLCWRYETNLLELMSRLHEGAIGDIVTLESTRYLGGVWERPRKPGMTDMEYQMRNWYYFTWLSGDFIAEQFVHELDQCAWAMQDNYPVRCYATGGRQSRTGEQHGHIYDHFNAIYEYDNGIRLFAGTRHQRGCSNIHHTRAYGTKGECDMLKFQITGENAWESGKRRTDMHQLEHNAMYAALRGGKIINNGKYMAHSTMMAIIARMSAYTGQTLTWEQAMNSKERLAPQQYTWDAELPDWEVAIPGKTKFL